MPRGFGVKEMGMGMRWRGDEMRLWGGIGRLTRIDMRVWRAYRERWRMMSLMRAKMRNGSASHAFSTLSGSDFEALVFFGLLGAVVGRQL